MTELFLNDVWSIYYHDPLSNDWSLSGYRFVCNVSSVNSFCRVYKALKDFWKVGNFFLMREHITPRWEDEYNIEGGCYSIKVSCDEFHTRWFDLCAGLLGETVAIDKQHSSNINGISATPKKNAFIIRIWLKDNKYANRDIYNFPCCKFSPVMYKKHKE